MQQVGRKVLPHEPPPWACDTTREIYFLTVCAQYRSEQPLLKNDVADQLLESIRFYHDRCKHIHVEWQRDFFDHRLRRDEHYDEKFQYILQNPVRAGLVTDWREWWHSWRATDVR